MIPASLTLEQFTAGCSFPVLDLTITVNGTAPTYPATLAVMKFVKGDVEVELSTADGSMTLTSAALWQFHVPNTIVPELTAGVWAWNFHITDSSGACAVYITDSLTVLPDV